MRPTILKKIISKPLYGLCMVVGGLALLLVIPGGIMILVAIYMAEGADYLERSDEWTDET